MATFLFTNRIPDFFQIALSVVRNLDSCQKNTAKRRGIDDYFAGGLTSFITLTEQQDGRVFHDGNKHWK